MTSASAWLLLDLLGPSPLANALPTFVSRKGSLMAVKGYLGVVVTSLTLAFTPVTRACGDCYAPANHIEHVRHVKRMQPDALNATYGPTRALEWGQLNFLHTTDTHGWLEGHLKERNYGADWGDFVTFSTHFKQQAGNMGVDLLLVDTGDLHDGAGLSDATSLDGAISINIFDDVDYDLLAIGNHELYLADVAYQTLNEISAYWGDKYLTSNVQIVDQETGNWKYIGKTHRYFTSKHGLRIMAFGVLFDFTGNTNVTKVIPAKIMVTQKWFMEAVNNCDPIDVFVLIGHNPVRDSSFQIVFEAIRAVHPNTPIHILGGHSHIRDFTVYDESSVAIESGRYCETLGWVSMSGFTKNNSGFDGIFPNPAGVPNPTRKATENSTSLFTFSRRYLDWNHAETWYDHNFDYDNGRATTADITKYREQLNLDELSDNIFPLLSQALAEVVVSEERNDTARYIISNTGGIRFDMYKGPFTYDDSFIVSPFVDAFLYIKDVPYAQASALLGALNNAGASGKRSLGYMPVERDICVDPLVEPLSEIKRDGELWSSLRGVTRRQVVDLVPGYTTKDDWGTDGDDTAHSEIPYYDIPDFFQGAAGFDENGEADVVDVVFVDFSQDVDYYISSNFTTRDYLPLFIKQSEAFQAGYPDCPSS
ncbi:hypothetical protein GQX73_g3246 [Xylaria multiplex]|uniref:Putative 5'-nucleotidase C-terminal domain-containing protein n=1 Tax=Xylaria multiplex TaxID=323545 RepID=A0A7C8IT40_9PEZI|nr:hypothetical protein GQX73_g3246 [Xylaria multiplex]